MDIVEVMKNKPDFYALQGASMSEIEKTEQRLGTGFAKEYRYYVSVMGAVSFAGHEFTGVCKSKRLNVFDVTIEQRKFNSAIPEDWYVLEETHIDGIVLWQSPSGEIYQAAADAQYKKIYESLLEYVSAI